MSVKVNSSYGKSGGLMSSPMLHAGELIGGAMTGDPMMMAGGLSANGGPAGQLAGTASKAAGVNDKFGSSSDLTPYPQSPITPGPLVSGGSMDQSAPSSQYDYDAMVRRLNSGNSNRTA